MSSMQGTPLHLDDILHKIILYSPLCSSCVLPDIPDTSMLKVQITSLENESSIDILLP